MIYWDSSPIFFSPLKTDMAEQNLQSSSLDTGPPSPQIVGFSWLKWLSFLLTLPLELVACEQKMAEPVCVQQTDQQQQYLET